MHKILIVLRLERHFLHEILSILLLIIHGQATRHEVNLRSLHLSAVLLHLTHPLLFLIPLDTQKFLLSDSKFYLFKLRSLHRLLFQMFLDDLIQVSSPCLLVLLINERRTLIAVCRSPSYLVKLEIPPITFMLVAAFHYLFFNS